MRGAAWKRVLILFCVLVIVDGAIRKWLLPQQADIVYFAKDVVLLISLSIFMANHSVILPPALRSQSIAKALIAYFLWTTIELANPRSPGIPVAIMGAKSHLLYIALIPMVIAAMPKSSKNIMRLVSGYVYWVALPIMLLAIYQFTQPPSAWINRYVNEIATGGIATVGYAGRPRVTGTFSYISGMTSFLFLNISLAIGLLLAGLRHGGRALYTAIILLCVCAVVAPMNGSRVAIYLPAMMLPLLLVEIVRRRSLNLRFLALTAIGIGLITPIAQDSSFQSGWRAFGERVASTTDTRSRIRDALVGPFERTIIGGLIGYGPGSTHQAAPLLVPSERPFNWLPTTDFEEETGRVGLELGAIGVVLYLLTKISCCLLALRTLRQARTAGDLIVGLAALIFLTVHLINGIVFNPISGAIYWALVGLVLATRLRQLQENTQIVQSRERYTRALRPHEGLAPVR